jgi:hypothetical protein
MCFPYNTHFGDYYFRVGAALLLRDGARLDCDIIMTVSGTVIIMSDSDQCLQGLPLAAFKFVPPAAPQESVGLEPESLRLARRRAAASGPLET